MSRKPLIAHVLYRFDTGGMERFILTLVNGTGDRYRHALVCLDAFGPLRAEIADRSVPCIALHKRPGKDLRNYGRLWRALRQLRPDLVQTYNFGALDIAPIARLAGARRVVHAERGRDASDPTGVSARYRRLHHWVNPFVARFLAVSRDLQRWLVDDVGIASDKVQYIGNGIDVAPYTVPSRPGQPRPLLRDFAPNGTLLFVNVGRLDPVKDQAGLIDAFAALVARDSAARARLRLAIVGGGPACDALQRRIDDHGVADCVRLLGMRADVPAILAESDVFVLSSIGEGMPGAVLEAMAAGLPVVATRAGGTGEVVVDGRTGMLVPPRDHAALAGAIACYAGDADLCAAHGRAGRDRAEQRFSLSAMLAAYRALYDELLAPVHATGRTTAIGRPAPARKEH